MPRLRIFARVRDAPVEVCKELLRIDSAHPVWQGRFSALRSDAHIVLKRGLGAGGDKASRRALTQDRQSLGQIDFYLALGWKPDGATDRAASLVLRQVF